MRGIMKTGRKGARIRRVLQALAAALVTGSCDDDPTDSDLTPLVVEIATTFAIQVSDARTGEPPGGVRLTLKGTAAARVRDVTGTPIPEVTVDGGFVALGLIGAVPTFSIAASSMHDA